MGEMGGDDFARGTARGIEAAMGERAARAELVAQELSKKVAELQAALAAERAANDRHTSPAPGEMGAQSGGETGTGSEMGGSDTASAKTQSTETASPRTPDFLGRESPQRRVPRRRRQRSASWEICQGGCRARLPT